MEDFISQEVIKRARGFIELISHTRDYKNEVYYLKAQVTQSQD